MTLPSLFYYAAVLSTCLAGAVGSEACNADADCAGPSLEKTANFLQVSLDLQDKHSKAKTGYAKAKATAEHVMSKEGRQQRSQRIKELLATTPSFCSRSNSNGFAQVIDDDKGSTPNIIMIDWTDAFEKYGEAAVSIQAMSKYGAYREYSGYKTVLGYANEIIEYNMLEFKPSTEASKIDLYRTHLEIRTTDEDSKPALANGLGSGWIDSLDRFPCMDETGKQRFIMDATPLYYSGFYMAETLGYPQRLHSSKSFERNLDIIIEYALEDPFRTGHTGEIANTVEFSITWLPEVPMKPRVADERLLYFDVQYTDKGVHSIEAPEKPASAVDSKVSSIWRWNLERLTDGQIKFYVDPSVPARWREYFRRGIEGWNDAFDLLGTGKKIVKGLCLGDEDWPEDYDIGDSRFSIISWTLAPSTVSSGIAKVDPRTGEIIKSDILMADTWVSAFLLEFETAVVNLTSPLSMLSTGSNTNTNTSKLKKPDGSQHEREKDKGINLKSYLARQGHPMNEEELIALIGAGLQDIVMHEVGHVLGLRHNFKGTMGISSQCLQDMSCTGKYGLSTSVMDYVPLNLPKEGSSYQTHIFNPVIGEYDKLAILYGYMNFSSDDADPAVRASLDAVLVEAENFETCYDDDQTLIQDPACLAYDISSNPVEYYQENIHRYASMQKELLQLSVQSGGSYNQYGKAVMTTLQLALSQVSDATSYIGGINNSYMRRAEAGSSKMARKPVLASMQREALALILQALRPRELGLMPSAEGMPYAVDGDENSISSVDITAIFSTFVATVVGYVLDPQRLQMVHTQEHLLDGVQNAPEVLTVKEFLSEAVAAFTSKGFENLTWEERGLQMTFAAKFASLQSEMLAPEISDEIDFQLKYLAAAVLSAYQKVSLSAQDPSWVACAAEGESCGCVGLVRYGSNAGWSAMLQSAGSIKCSAKTFTAVVDSVGKSSCECLASFSSDGELAKIHLAKVYSTVAR